MAMKDISIYFSPVSTTTVFEENTLFSNVNRHTEDSFPDLNKEGVALIYVPEYRGTEHSSTVQADVFRNEFYQLYKGDGWNFELYDLGTIQPGDKVEDTYFALSQVVTELIKVKIIPVVVGGGQDLTMACFKGYEPLEQMVNMCAIDSKLDIGSPDDALMADGFVSHLLMQRPCYLFNYSVIGVQRPLVPKDALGLFDRLYFDICRLGEFNANFKVAEPYLRNSEIISIDFNSVKSGETDPKWYSNPNGFYMDQLCQLAKYSGLSDKTTCLGIFNVRPEQNRVASSGVAQVIWYFLDGVAQRVGDFPIGSKKNYVKFHVHMDDFKDDLVFYKSDKSGRWWLEVKYPAGESGKYERHQLIPCNKEDYEGAMENNIPNLWWRTLQKLS